jgi:hypothetical protein
MQPPTVKLVHAVPLVVSAAAISLIAPEDRMHDRLRMHNLRTVQKYFHGGHGPDQSISTEYTEYIKVRVGTGIRAGVRISTGTRGYAGSDQAKNGLRRLCP